MSYSLYKKDALVGLEEMISKMRGESKVIGVAMIAHMKGYDVYHNREMMKKDVEIAKLEGYIEGLKNEKL